MKEGQFNVSLARQETPGCQKVIHFNNAGASLMPSPVIKAVVDHIKTEAEIGGYEAAEKFQKSLENSYDAIAALLNCQREEVAIIENATRAWDMAFYSIPFKEGEKILTCQTEYSSNFLAFLQVAKRTGAKIEVVPNDEQGQISITALQKLVDKKVKLIAITHVPTNGGLVNPAIEVGRVAREARVIYLLDACQSVGQIPIDVEKIGCDMLSATSRKFLRGPRGMGFLFVRKELIPILEPPFIDLHAAEWIAADKYQIRKDARKFENWETNNAAKIGLGVAIDYARSWGLKAISKRVNFLAESLRATLKQIPRVRVHDLGREKCGIVSFTIEKIDLNQVKKKLSDERINLSVSDLSATRLDMESRSLSQLLRASVHYYNSTEEIQQFCHLLANLL